MGWEKTKKAAKRISIVFGAIFTVFSAINAGFDTYKHIDGFFNKEETVEVVTEAPAYELPPGVYFEKGVQEPQVAFEMELAEEPVSQAAPPAETPFNWYWMTLGGIVFLFSVLFLGRKKLEDKIETEIEIKAKDQITRKKK